MKPHYLRTDQHWLWATLMRIAESRFTLALLSAAPVSVEPPPHRSNEKFNMGSQAKIWSRMPPVQVDIIGLQPPEARFHSLHHILTMIAGRVRIGARSSIGVIRGQHHALAMVLYKLAEKRFARPVCDTLWLVRSF